MKVCLGGLLGRFAPLVCDGGLLRRLALEVYLGGLLWRIALEVCTGGLLWSFPLDVCSKVCHGGLQLEALLGRLLGSISYPGGLP